MKDKIRDIFWELYKDNPIEKISVTEITKLAKCNRGTFYLYYKNVSDVLQETEDEVFAQMSFAGEQILSFLLEGKELPKEKLQFFLSVFEGNEKYISILLGRNGNPRFVYRLKKIFKEKVIKVLNIDTKICPPTVNYTLEYMISAHVNIINFWFEQKKNISFDELILLLRAILQNGAATVLMSSMSEQV